MQGAGPTASSDKAARIRLEMATSYTSKAAFSEGLKIYSIVSIDIQLTKTAARFNAQSLLSK